ncbi:hypothetical protein [Desulfopila inferna]|uniref:hypothetical protein n=1 Tax=Desulfopila inferna TaxID=468528 RepID=UPI0019650CDE|nr:hypothetical protein [Desulfopila inferna]MBM9604956.1 hypothetical protein [Desulfopila inferna]
MNFGGFFIVESDLEKLFIHDVAKKFKLLGFAALTANLLFQNAFGAIGCAGADERKPNVLLIVEMNFER